MSHEVAVIGLAGRFPGAPDPDRFWDNLRRGVVSIRPVTPAEQDEAVRAGAPIGEAGAPAVAPVDRPDLFEPEFFDIPAQEALITDPQHRLFLECCWEALENAGYDPYRVPGVAGVVGGCGFPGYLIQHVLTNLDLLPPQARVGLAVAGDRDSLASKVCYKLDLRGPAMTVQSFSSTSLVCVHVAVQSLLNFEADVMLAGSAAVSFPQVVSYPAMSSTDGSSSCYDARARGTVIGNAVAVVALKRLDDALRDGDRVWAVIEGSATNNDGAQRAGYTAPSLAGKAGVVAEALAAAGLRGEDIGYIEGQGIANVAGDSIEIAALGRGMRLPDEPAAPCVLGSLAANVGHLEGASGAAGLIKSAYMLARRELPPQADFQQPNQALATSRQFTVNRAARSWEQPPEDRPRRVGVSSYGIGGVNAHVILREPPRPDGELSRADAAGEPGPQVLVLSARSEQALAHSAERLRSHLATADDLDLRDVAYTLQVGRTPFAYRLALVCADREEAVRRLADPGLLREAVGPVGEPAGLVLSIRPGAWDVRELAAGLRRGSDAFRRAYDRFGPNQRQSFDDEADRVRAALGSALTEAVPPSGPAGRAPHARERIADLVRAAQSTGESYTADFSGSRHARITVELGSGFDLGPTPRDGWPGVLAALWLRGAAVDWSALRTTDRSERRPSRVPLPTYPFERRSYWIDAPDKPRPVPVPVSSAAEPARVAVLPRTA